MSLTYLLLIYAAEIGFIIITCIFISNMKRFYLITDDKPREEQSYLPKSLGGRRHPLFNRARNENLCAFEYAYFLISSVNYSKHIEIEFILNLKLKMDEKNIKETSLRIVEYTNHSSVGPSGHAKFNHICSLIHVKDEDYDIEEN